MTQLPFQLYPLQKYVLHIAVNKHSYLSNYALQKQLLTSRSSSPWSTTKSYPKTVHRLRNKEIEGNNPGLTYTALSRATTLGDPDDIMTSALFFNGPLTPDRLMNITTRMDNK
jgi:hypothetical protein